MRLQSDRRSLAVDALGLAAVSAALSYVLGGFGLGGDADEVGSDDDG